MKKIVDTNKDIIRALEEVRLALNNKNVFCVLAIDDILYRYSIENGEINAYMWAQCNNKTTETIGIVYYESFYNDLYIEILGVQRNKDDNTYNIYPLKEFAEPFFKEGISIDKIEKSIKDNVDKAYNVYKTLMKPYKHTKQRG